MMRNDDDQLANHVVTQEDLERVLAVGRLLLSVLTPEEVEQLRAAIAAGKAASGDNGRLDQEKVTLAFLDAPSGMP